MFFESCGLRCCVHGLTFKRIGLYRETKTRQISVLFRWGLSDRNKFNFSEEPESADELQDKKVAESKKAIKEDAKELATNVRGFFSELLDFRHDTDREQRRGTRNRLGLRALIVVGLAMPAPGECPESNKGE